MGQAVTLLVDGVRGIYAAQHLATTYTLAPQQGEDRADFAAVLAVVKAGPSSPDYVEAADALLRAAELHVGGRVYTLMECNGEIFGADMSDPEGAAWAGSYG